MGQIMEKSVQAFAEWWIEELIEARRHAHPGAASYQKLTAEIREVQSQANRYCALEK